MTFANKKTLSCAHHIREHLFEAFILMISLSTKFLFRTVRDFQSPLPTNAECLRWRLPPKIQKCPLILIVRISKGALMNLWAQWHLKIRNQLLTRENYFSVDHKRGKGKGKWVVGKKIQESTTWPAPHIFLLWFGFLE